MQKVIFSYMSEDFDVVTRMFKNLSANGLDVWMDKNSITPGVEWGKSFSEALMQADVVISFYSSSFKADSSRIFNNEQVEIDRAIQKKSTLKFFPIRVDNCGFPHLKFDGVQLKEMHCLDLFGDAADKFNKFFKFFDIDSPKVISAPDSELIIRCAECPYKLSESAGEVSVHISSPDQVFFLEFGSSEKVLVRPGEITLQAYFDANNHLPENEYWVEWFSKSDLKSLKVEPFSKTTIEISCVNWETTNSFSEPIKGLFRMFGVLPKYNDRKTWPIGIMINEIKV